MRRQPCFALWITARHNNCAAGLTPADWSDHSNGLMDHSSGFTLATVLIGGSGLFVLATLFFGTKGGYYDTDQYDGNGTAH